MSARLLFCNLILQIQNITLILSQTSCPKTTSVMENSIPNGVHIKYLSQRNNKKSHALSQTAVQPLCPEIANSRTVCFRKREVWPVEKYMEVS